MRKLTSYIKCFLSVVLVTSVLLMMTPVWGMTSDSAEETGEETADLEIGTEQDLLNFAERVNDGETFQNQTVVLTDYINLSEVCGEKAGGKSWIPIGNNDKKFRGTFDGKGFEITGLYIDENGKDYQGLFGNVDGGTIKSLTVSGSVSSVSGKYVGGIVGRHSGGKIENCINRVDVSGNGNSVGGVVGEKKDGTIINCKNEATVTATGKVNYAGGIVGLNQNCTVQSCNNFGKVTGSSSVGGVVGGNKDGVIGGNINESCTNDAEVIGNNMVGGIVGEIESGAVKGCINKGTVKGADNSTSDYVGGIVGKNGFKDNKDNFGIGAVQSCINEGQISGGSHAGGIVGRNEKGTIEDCTNYSKATVTGGGNTVGGVAGSNGDVTEDCLIQHCINEAAVNGSGSNVGGVVGENKGTVRVSFNTGGVIGSKGNVGGVVGDSYGRVEICYNTGTVTGTVNNVGGVVGRNNQGAALKDCYNTNTVTGSSNVGGIVGDNSIKVTNCYNVGAVSGDSVYGGVFGANNTGSAENCFYFAWDDSLKAIGSGVESTTFREDADGFKTKDTFTKVEWNFAEVNGVWEMGVTKDGEIVRPILTEIKEYPLDTLPVKSDGTGDDNDPDNGGDNPEDSNSSGNSEDSNSSGNSEDNNSGGNSEDSNSSGNSEDSNSSGNSEDSNSSGNSEDSNSSGNSEDSNPSGNSENSNSSGDSEDSNSSGDSEDSNSGGNSEDSNPSGNSEDNNSSGNSEDSNSSGTSDESEPSGSPGNVKIDTVTGEKAPKTTISEETSSKLKDEVVAEHLTDEEKTAVERGDDLDIILRVEDAGDTVTAEDRQITETVLAEIEYTVGMYLNIELIKLINGVEVDKITKINSLIRVTIEIPEELRSANRAFAIVRIHNGSADIIADVDDDPDTITILTDKFSIYSIAYKDTEDLDFENPDTGISRPVAMIALAGAVIVAAVAVEKRKMIK